MKNKYGAHLEPSNVGHHTGEEGIAGDVEGNTQTHVSGPLVQLT